MSRIAMKLDHLNPRVPNKSTSEGKASARSDCSKKRTATVGTDRKRNRRKVPKGIVAGRQK